MRVEPSPIYPGFFGDRGHGPRMGMNESTKRRFVEAEHAQD